MLGYSNLGERLCLILSHKQQKNLECQVSCAKETGDLRETKRCLALLAKSAGQATGDIAKILQVSTESVRQWITKFLIQGTMGIVSKSSTGRPTKLTESQRAVLSEIIRQGPQASGFPGGCWRTPMIQFLIQSKFNVSYSVKYLSELLKNMGFSYQKATFISAKQDKQARKEWLQKKWPEILQLAKQKNTHILFGDESSFPQWGTLNYTWASKGQQPVIETCGSRKSYKVFGLIDYFTGTFYSKGQEEKLNSESYAAFLTEVLSRTRKHIILIHDNASYHVSAAMRAFFKENKYRVTVYPLPTFSPDYNPIEMLWKKIKQAGTHLQYFPTFNSLILKVEDMLELFGNVKKEVLSLFGFYIGLQCI